MTSEPDVELHERLAALAAAVPVEAPGGMTVVSPHMRTGRTGRRFALGGFVPLIAVLVIATVVAGLAKLGPFAPGTTQGGNGPVTSTNLDGQFELTVRSAKARYTVSEPLEIEATLVYRGAGDVVISHAQGAPVPGRGSVDGPDTGGIGGPLGFGIVEPVIGDLVLGPSWAESCERTTLVRDVPLTVPFAKSGGFSGSNPRADEYRALLTDPVLRLTHGVWHVYAVAEFSLGGCGGEQHALRATIEVEVVAESNPTTAPTSDPSSSIALPPTPFGQVTAAQLDWAAGMVRSYGAEHPESFAALWINRPEDGPVAIASSWTRDLEVHRAWMAANIGFLVPYSVFPARFTKVELEGARDQIEADLSWLEALPAHVMAFSAGGSDNLVRLDVSSSVADAPTLIQAHYSTALGFDPEMLIVTSDGTGAYFVPWGTVKVTLNLPSSGVPADVELRPGWRSSVNGLRCGQGDVGVGFEELPCQEGTWTILVEAWREGDRLVVGSGFVNVKAGTTVELAIDVEPIPVGAWPSPTPAPSVDG